MSVTNGSHAQHKIFSMLQIQRFFALVFVVPSFLGACASGPDSTSRTWSSQIVNASDIGSNESCIGWIRTVGQKCLNKLSVEAKKSGDKYPAIVFLHGCDGINPDMASWIQRHTNTVVFEPNSFSRPNRVIGCNAGKRRPAISLRRSEASYARQQIAVMDWVDQDRVFLAGFSEGAGATATYRGDDYTARIIIGDSCRLGIEGSGPILNLIGSEDEWRQGVATCNLHGRNKSFAALIEGAGHNLTGVKAAEEALRKFINQF